MKNKEKNILKRTILRSILLVLSIFSLVIGILITVEGLTNNKEKKENIVNYETGGKIEYNVTLKDNDFYDLEDINTKNIISKYLNTLDINFKYEFSSSKALHSNATYSLKMYLINSYTQNNNEEELWRKEYELLPETKITENKAVVYFEKQISINYDEYNEIARKFRSESGILTNSYLQLEFSINNELMEETKNISFGDNYVLVVKIPLLENITSIEKLGEFNEKENLYNIEKIDTNYLQLSIGILLLIVSIAFMITAARMFININEVSKYITEQGRILKRYGDVIAETTTKPDLNNLDVMEITNFIDLINIEDELRIPILFYENIKGKESWFIIIHNTEAYRYILKAKTKSKKN